MVKKYKNKSNKRFIDMNKKRWASDVKSSHGTLTAVIQVVLYSYFSETNDITNFSVWLTTNKFNFKSVDYKKRKERIINALHEFTPEYYKINMIKEVILYKNYVYYSEESHLKSFDIATALLTKISLDDKKIHAKFEFITKEKAIKEFNKFIGYKVKRNNKLKVLGVFYG